MSAAGAPPEGEGLIVDLDGYEGPLDVLLMLARTQKVDLARLSILDLAEQYLAFIETARDLRLELAADYLVMAAWLAYLKSRLLLPDAPDEDEPSAAEMAAALTHRLRQLEAMRTSAEALLRRPRLGFEVFARGAPEGIRVISSPVWEVGLPDLIAAYARQRRSSAVRHYEVPLSALHSVHDAIERLGRLVGHALEWTSLLSFLPPGLRRGVVARSALAAMFAASLELAREGRIDLRQGQPFAPIYIRRTGTPR